MSLTARDRAVLAFLVKAGTDGAAPRDVSRGTPGGNAYPTIVSLARRGLVALETSQYRRGPVHVNRASITADGLEAFLLSGV